jgi:hypothetical protein
MDSEIVSETNKKIFDAINAFVGAGKATVYSPERGWFIPGYYILTD